MNVSPALSPNKKPTVFISYSSMDGLIAEEVNRQLTLRGFEVWYDQNLVQVGEAVKDALMEKLRQADVVLCLLSESSIRSANVMSELGVALEAERSNPNKMLLSVHIGKVQPPYNIADRKGIYLDVEDVRVLPSRGFDRAIKSIEEAIRSFVARRSVSDKAPTALSERPQERPRQYREARNGAIIDDEPNWWLLRMNPETWPMQLISVGTVVYFDTLYFNEMRPERGLFDWVSPGELVLAYKTEPVNALVCLLEITAIEDEKNSPNNRILMRVAEVFVRPLPRDQVASRLGEQLSRLYDNRSKPPELWYQLSAPDFTYLLEAARKYLPASAEQRSYLPYYEPEGQFRSTEDRLGFTPDIESFARVIALESVTPPLAIGLFGNWGTGKSFFMRKLEERIGVLARDAGPGYVQKVVPVWFNSWHYSDTNLWASLTAHIFERLHSFAVETGQKTGYQKIAEQLQFTQVQLDAVEQKLAEQEQKITDADQRAAELEREIQEKKETLDCWSANDLIKVAWRSPIVRADVQELQQAVGMGEMVESYAQAEKKLQEVKTKFGRTQKALVQMSRFASGKWLLIGLITLAFVFCCSWLWVEGLENIQWLVGKITAYFLAATAWFTSLSAVLRPHYKKVMRWRNKLLELQRHVEEEREKALKPEYALRTKTQQELEDLKRLRDGLIRDKRRAEETKKRLQQSVEDLVTGKAMTEFLLQRSTDDSYASQLGIISLIRKDFQRLDELLAQQREARRAEGGKTEDGIWIDRIVLYIDDLDRCSETTVVKVLEAIHLLLAFPLFVVVVGVDPRWLDKALNMQFGKQFLRHGEKGASAPVTSYDYLEKIFQVPFTLKPMTERSKSDLLAYLVRNDMKVTSVKEQEARRSGEESSSADGQAEAALRNDSVGAAGAPTAGIDTNNGNGAQANSAGFAKELPATRLVITPPELEFMQRVAPLFGRSARAMHRFVNIYRLVKAHGDLMAPQGYTERVYCPILILLGLIMSPGYDVEEFAQQLRGAFPASSFREFCDSASLQPELKPLCDRIAPLLKEVGQLKVSDFQSNLELVSRFCFRLHTVDQ